MFTITGPDRRLAQTRAGLERMIELTFGDIISKRHPHLTTPAAEFIASASLEQVLEDRTKLLRYRYCRGVDAQLSVHVLVTTLSLTEAADEQGIDHHIKMSRKMVLGVIRKFVAEEIKVEAIRGPLQHGDDEAGRLTLPGYEYYSFYLSTDPYPATH